MTRLDHVGLDVSDYEASKAFYEQALDPLGMKLMMEPVPGVGGFGDDFPFFWIGQRERGPDSGVHVAFRVEDRSVRARPRRQQRRGRLSRAGLR